jgi:hypothetical protein
MDGSAEHGPRKTNRPVSYEAPHQEIIRAAEIRDELSFTSFRHGGFTEAADSDLTRTMHHPEILVMAVA